MKHLKKFIYILIMDISLYPKTKPLNQKMIVCSAVANLRGVPQNIDSNFKLPGSAKTNPFQITQLLLNEPVIAQKSFTDKKNNNWYLVKAIQQPNKNKDGNWSGLIGWIEAKNLIPVQNFEKHNLVITSLFADIYNTQGKKINTLFIGTQFTGTYIPEKNLYQITLPNKSYGYIKTSDTTILSKNITLTESEIRKNIIKTAEKFLGNVYSWGGRTPQTDLFPISSIDCSGLINLVFAGNGLLIPRNSVSQYLKAKHIKHGKNLKPGDLIFFANSKHKISHVLFYVGNGNVIESSLTVGEVKESSFKKRIGFDHFKMKSGDLSGPIMTLDSNNPTFFKIYFASFLSDQNMIHKLRADFLETHF